MLSWAIKEKPLQPLRVVRGDGWGGEEEGMRKKKGFKVIGVVEAQCKNTARSAQKVEISMMIALRKIMRTQVIEREEVLKPGRPSIGWVRGL